MKCNYNRKSEKPLDASMTMLSTTFNSWQQVMKQSNREFYNGEIVYFTDTEECMVYNDGSWIPLSNITITKDEENKLTGLQMSVYDLNKQVVNSFPIVEDWTEFEKTINEFNKKNITTSYMLLCKDISYYTIFQEADVFVNFGSLGEAVLTCANDIGGIVAVDLTENEDAIEIWVRTPEGENLCMYFFDCSGLIVTYSYHV